MILLKREDLEGTLIREVPARVASIADLLPWDVFLDQGVVGIKRHGYLAGWRLQGRPKLEAGGSGETLAAWTRALLQLSQRCLVHHVTHRFETGIEGEPSHYPDAWSRAVETERLQRFERDKSYSVRQSLWLSWYPTKTDAFLSPEREVEAFERVSSELARSLEGCTALSRLDNAEICADLAGMVQQDNTESMAAPPEDGPLDCWLAQTAMRATDSVLQIGERWVVPISLVTVPTEVRPSLVERLSHVRASYRIVHRLVMLDQESARKGIESKRRGWGLSAFSWSMVFRGLMGVRAVDRAESPRWLTDLEDECDEAIGGLWRDRHVLLTSVVFVYGKTQEEAEHSAAAIREEMRRQGMGAERELWDLGEVWHGALPGVVSSNLRRHQVPLPYAVSLLSKQGVDSGPRRCPHPKYRHLGPLLVVRTPAGEPYRLSLHADDVGHTLIVGPTGSGKSVLLNCLVFGQRRYRGAIVRSLDVDGSQVGHALASGSEYFELDPASSAPVAPLAMVGDVPGALHALGFVAELIHQQGVQVGPTELKLLRRALQQCGELDRQHRTLTTFAAKVSSQSLRTALSPYVEGGAYGALFDGVPAESKQRAPYVLYEMRHVLNSDATVRGPMVRHLLSEFLSALDQRSLGVLAIEEGPRMMESSRIVSELKDVLQTVRKLHGSIWFVAHDPIDIVDGPLSTTLQGACQTRIFLPRRSISERSAAAYRDLGLTDRLTEELTEAVPRRQYLVTRPEGHQWFDLELSDLALAAMGVAGRESAELLKFKARHGERWLEHWLESRDVKTSERELYLRHLGRETR
ncbi:MAG: hypothetical protein MPN21_22945 [Thermoanaerobaculia bacterium]|nr:hypothetical protein [Thermoanaerobaculia bacterium]